MRRGRGATLRQEQRGGQLRCAIYTRKSTEEGLDQEFNSLDAQREACEAYIVSQRHEGWLLVPDRYDDGGFSGGSMERPGLKRLLGDVRSGKVDVIVVYKVDRLTRALSDFAKIVDTLDAAEASFVSITQAFNTTTSMGRLTLNVLLSFAQFEREVISERVRDKIAASKAKGMWMGGTVPLGYDVVDRKLIANESEAATVRHIMQSYIDLGSVPALMEDLRVSGIVTKRQTMRDGSSRGGIPFARGPLHHFLKNRIYRGDITHHDKIYPGEHDAIVSAELFDSVQAQLAANIGERRSGKHFRHPSLLAGMIRDASDRPMSPSHAVKAGKRYRYYVSNEAVPAEQSASAKRIPAAALDASVIRAVSLAVADTSLLLDGIGDVSARQISRIRQVSLGLAEQLKGSRTADVRTRLLAIDLQVIVHADRIEASCSRKRLLALFDPALEILKARSRVSFDVPASLQRRGHEVKLRLEPTGDVSAPRDPKLVNLIVRAHAAREQLSGADFALPSQARRELARVARASYLAPDIVTAIFEGRQPPSLGARKLERIGNLPICWKEQRLMLGFG